jgi:hypothetical protein
MGTARFITLNLLELSTVVLKNGTGGAPARDEIAPYVMENALERSRRVLWQAAGAGTVNVDLDLASHVQTRAGGIIGHRPLGASSDGIDSFKMQYNDGNTYPPAGWTDLFADTPTDQARDKGIVWASNITLRYVRYALTCGGPFTLGRLLLGLIDLDLGLLPSSQLERSHLPMVVDRTAGEDPVVTVVGDIRSRFTLRFRSITGTVLAKLQQLAALGGLARDARPLPFIWIDGDDVFRELIVDGELEHELKWISGATKLYDCDLQVEQLG